MKIGENFRRRRPFGALFLCKIYNIAKIEWFTCKESNILLDFSGGGV